MQQQNRRINIIIFLLVTFIIVAGNNTTAKAVDSYISGDYEYQLDTFYGENGKTTYASINKYTGLSEIVAVPETIAGYPVWKLENTFAYNQTVSKVIIPSNVKYLNATFTHCDNLKSVVLPSTITDYYFAFQSCKRLTEIEIPGGTYSMFRAFEDCTSLKSVKINGLIVAEEPRDSSIGTCGIFYGCSSLETVSIKGIVGDRNIGDTFYGCDNLKSIEIQESVSNIRKLFNKCTALETVYLPKGLKSINNAFEYCYKLKDIYFAGSECEWNAIKIDVDNPNIDKFKNATIHYSSEGGHIYSEWETTLQATCFKGGSRERHCTICGEAETENIPKLTPVLTVGKKSVKLAKAKSVSLKVSFTSGDSVTAKSSDKKIATVIIPQLQHT